MALVSCIGKPEFEDSPTISFKSISNNFFKTPAPTDSVTLIVKFTDGDGDLGLDGNEQQAPYNPVNPDGEANLFTHNFFLTIFRKNGDNLTEVKFPDGASYSGRFLRLNKEEDDKPLEGEIKYSFGLPIGFFNSPIKTGDSLSFEVQIADRRLRLSNKITTPVIGVGIEKTEGQGN